MSNSQINNDSLTGANPVQSTPNSEIIYDSGNVINTLGNTMQKVFDINKISVAAQNYNAINGIVNKMLGYEFKWFRAVPQQRSKDVIFQEYTLSNVENCPLDIKAVIPTGNMPDSKYNFDLFGLEYELPFEIQIDKKYWESIAGFGTAPQKKDIVYFPMANKLYQVESSYLNRGFMEQETTWKINLKKYQPESSRREGTVLQETIDNYTVSVEEVFGTAIDENVQKTVNDTQFSPFNATSQDKYKSFDVSLNVISEAVNIYGTMISQSFYDLQSSNYTNALTYNLVDRISSTTDRSITAWIYPRTISNIHKEYSVISISEITSTDPSYNSANYTIVIDPRGMNLNNIQLNSNIVISRPGALNFYAKVVAITENPLQLHCLINSFVLEDLNEIKTDWNLQKGYKLTIKEPISIIDGVNDFNEHILSVNIYANQYIAINYGHTYSNDDAYVVRMNDKINDNEWYGIIVNIGNSWQQYNVNVWKKHETDKNVKLQSEFYETLRLYPEDLVIDNYSINKSPSYLTNLKIFNTTIEEEKQINELLSYFTKDGDQIILSDQSDAIVKMPYISRQR